MPDQENIIRDHFESGLSPADFYAMSVSFYSELFRSPGKLGLQLMDHYLETNAPELLKSLLEVVCLAYSSNVELRQHIRNISAKYQFEFGGNNTTVSVEIRNNYMRTYKGKPESPDVCLKFREPDSLRKLLFTAQPDILRMILDQEVRIDGNLNYLLKFIYLIRHLQLKLTGPE